MQQSGGFGRLATIKTRGLRNQDTAILIDGYGFAMHGDNGRRVVVYQRFYTDKRRKGRGACAVRVRRFTERTQSGGWSTIRHRGSGRYVTVRSAERGAGWVCGDFAVNISHGDKSGKFGISGAVSRTEYTKGIDGDDNADNTGVQTRIDAKPCEKTSISGRIFCSDANVRLNSSPDTRDVAGFEHDDHRRHDRA